MTTAGEESGGKVTKLDFDFDKYAPSPSRPRDVADFLLTSLWMDETLRRHRQTFYEWEAGYWTALSDSDIRARLTEHLKNRQYKSARDEVVSWAPNPRNLRDAIEMLGDAVHVPDGLDPPAWVELPSRRGLNRVRPAQPDPRELLVTQNGILHLPSRNLLPHDPELFSFRSVPFPFDPEAQCPSWVAFLRSLKLTVGDVALLEEWMGYVISGQTNLQKIFVIVGPRRSGKGTIARTLMSLVGDRHVSNPTLSAFKQNFGLEDAIGKTLIVVSDARLGGRRDIAVLVERLLSLSGEDSLTVDRKHKAKWTGRLGVRVMVTTNELPKIEDAAGALASRMVALWLRESFLGHEDHLLEARLKAELPGILNRALDGYDRLRASGRFTSTMASREVVRVVEELASPAASFVAARCSLEDAAVEDKDELYAEFQRWLTTEGHRWVPTKAVFFRDLRAAFPQLRSYQPREEGRRPHRLRGIRLLGGGTGYDGSPPVSAPSS